MLGRDVVAAAGAPATRSSALARAELDITDAAAVARRRRRRRARRGHQLRRVDRRRRRRDRRGRTPRAVNGAGAGNVAARGRRGAARCVVHVSTRLRLRRRRDRAVRSRTRRPARGPPTAAPSSPASARSPRPAPRHAIVRTAWVFGAARQELRGHHAAPRRRARRGDRRRRPGRLPDLHRATSPPRCVDGRRARGRRHRARRRRRPLLVVRPRVATFEQPALDVRGHRGTTARLARPAPRPAYSRARAASAPTRRALPDWREGLTRLPRRDGRCAA